MSGIAGIIHFDGKPIEPGLIEKMTSAMAHRGPDGINHWVKGSVALGQCMLRTTPESLEEHQPLTNEDESLVLVMDGRVDNWEELRRELLGHGAVLRNRADAELVLRAYEIWGRDCLAHIDGDFALVIWDVRRREAFCARDRMGNKPFNYHWDSKTFVFASELHTILALPWVQEMPNEGMLAEFLADERYSRDETLWQGVLRLVAAHRLLVDAQGPRLKQYWAPDVFATLPYTKDEDYIEHYRDLFKDIVQRMSRSHQPVAYEVSGGLDSSAVFCMAEHLRRSGRLHAPSIQGFTLAFSDENAANELEYARIVAKHLGIPVHEVPPSVMPLPSYAERANAEREFPGFPNASMFMGIQQMASLRGSRVALGGEGGDVWLRGSRTYYAEELAEMRWSTLYDCFKSDARIFGARQAMKWLIRHGFFPLLPLALQESLQRLVRGMRGSGTRDLYWLSPRMKKEIEWRRELSRLRQSRQVRTLSQWELIDMLYDAFIAQAMEGAERRDAHSVIEYRHPFRSPQFVQYAFSTPERLRLRGERTKFIHVQALQGIMPKMVLERKSKAEFSVVFRVYQDRMKDVFCDTLPRKRACWITPDGMTRLFQAYQDNPQAGWPMWILWGIYGCDAVMS